MTGLKFSVCSSGYSEDLNLSLRPRDLARFLSRRKAEAVAYKFRDAVIIAADTFIIAGNRVLGKPHTMREARSMLQALSGKAHSVITGFTIIDTLSGAVVSRSVETIVYFRNLSGKEISAYVRSKEPMDKAGAYAIQGLGSVFIRKIEGDYYNVMGLPLHDLTVSLDKFGIHVLNTRMKN